MKNDGLKPFNITKRIKAVWERCVTNQRRGGGSGEDESKSEACDCRKEQKKMQSNARRKL